MIIKDLSERAIVSTRSFNRIELIDGGDTLVVHMTCSDQQPVAVMMPRATAQALIAALADDLLGNLQLREKPST